MKKLIAIALALSLGACATAPNGDETVAGIDTGISAAKVAVAQADVQTAINALPELCSKFAVAATLTAAEASLLQSTAKLPAKTVANISNASATGQLICNGTVAIVAAATPAS
jgi:hypothetical protein